MAFAEEPQNGGANEARASGNNLWLIDAHVLFGGREEALAARKIEFLGDRTVKSLQPPPGKGLGVVSL